MKQIGFIQGRLSPIVNGKIQSFPWKNWTQEFSLAKDLGLRTMEWTLDQENLYENPLMTKRGRDQVRKLCAEYDLSIPSLTGDCFMQAPFYKSKPSESERLLKNFEDIVIACRDLGVEFIVFPLVDSGSLESKRMEDELIAEMNSFEGLLGRFGMKIVFESDYPPPQLGRFIDRFPSQVFGINYDSGNSASFGFDPLVELATYGERVYNVHIKDRVRGGQTVVLGTGDTDFDAVFRGLAKIGYEGNLILQGARAPDGDHEGIMRKYLIQLNGWIKEYLWT